MKKKLNVIAVIVVLMVLAGIFAGSSTSSFNLFGQNQSKKHKIAIKKMKNKETKMKEWKAVDAEDSLVTKIKVKKGDEITWDADGSDLYFQFMDNQLFGSYTYYLKDGQKLKLTVSSKAEAKTYQYAVFCIADLEFARGDSPPVIVVE
jgi:hypothetical protein